MAIGGYLFEKASYVCDGLARTAESVKQVGVGTPVHQEVMAHLDVAALHALRCMAIVTGCKWESAWPKRLVNECSPYWKKLAKSLEAGIDNEITYVGPTLRSEAARTLSALLDLVDVLRKHDLLGADEGSVNSALAFAFNGMTKVITTIHISDWEDEWPGLLLSRGRSGLEGYLEGVRSTAKIPLPDSEEYHPLQDDVWLAQQDPDWSAERNAEAERKRRASLTEKTRLPGDLRIPTSYTDKPLDVVLDPNVPEHATCAEYARAPQGRSLVLVGIFTSGLFDIQWAIGRYWFVERLARVLAIDWHELAEDNLLAQTRSVWTAPHLLIGGLRPIYLDDNSKADPGYAEKLVQYRLREHLPTVISIERYGPQDLGLQEETLRLLEQAVNVHLPPLEDRQRREW